MKTLRMITCFLITSMFVLLLLIPGKGQASDVDGIWAVEVYTNNEWAGGPPDECPAHEYAPEFPYYGTWIVGLEGDRIFGACTWVNCPVHVNPLSGVLKEVEGVKKVKIVRTTMANAPDHYWVQTYEGDLDGNSIINGKWSGNGCGDGSGVGENNICDWSATIYEDRIQIDPLPVDNSDATVYGDWATWHCDDGGDCSQIFGDDLRYIETSSTGEVTWTTAIPSAGTYKVYAWWYEDTNRATNAPYTIYYDGGSATISVDQTTNGGQWNQLGTYAFAQGTAKVELTNDNASGYVIADAIKWERVQ